MYVNGQKTDITYIKGSSQLALIDENKSLTIPEDNYYITSDNRTKPESMVYDSRGIGPIPSNFIQLKVVKCYQDCK